MKKLFILFLVLLKISSVRGQEPDTIPPYQKDSFHLPAFTILKTDSIYANDREIPKDKPVIIVYFSPECGHCQLTAQDFSGKMKNMRKFYFIWVSYYPLPEIKEFAKNFHLQQFRNIIIGRDLNYAIPSFFRIKFTPFMAVYDKDHHLLQTYEKGIEADTIINLLKAQ